MRRAWLLVALAAALAAAALLQTRGAPVPPLAGWFPPGPALYLEAKDFAGLLASWNASAEKTRWLGSANYEVFRRSRLFMRLEQAHQEYAAAAGVPADMNLVAGIAGAEAALALYDVGQIEFLYVSRVPSARALESVLWRAKERFDSRHAAGIAYYARTEPASRRTAAFAVHEGLFFLATREELLAGALALVAGRSQGSLLREGWFEQAARAGGQPGDLRLALHIPELVRSPHFRSYWIHRNVSKLRPFAAGVVDLRRSAAEFREERVLVRAPGQRVAPPDESPVGAVMALAGDDAGFYRAVLAPEPNAVVAAIRAKIFGEPLAAPVSSTSAPLPEVAPAGAGSEADLGTRIDEAPYVGSGGAAAAAPLTGFLEPREVRAMLEVTSSRAMPDGAFVFSEPVIVLLGAADWDLAAARAALTASGSSLWGVSFGAAARGPLLAIARNQAAAEAILSKPPRAGVAGASYIAGYNHLREFPHYVRLMRLLDSPPFQADPNVEPEPPFFSANLASLGQVLSRMRDASIVVRDTGGELRQTVVYRMSP